MLSGKVQQWFWRLAAVLTVVVGYQVCMGALEWLRLRAGVCSGTATVLDVLAWLSCIGLGATLAGCAGRLVFPRCARWGAALMVPVLALAVAVDFKGRWLGGGSDAFLAVFGWRTSLALAWVTTIGFATGYVVAGNREHREVLWVMGLALLAALLGLCVVFYPAEQYLMRTYG